MTLHTAIVAALALGISILAHAQPSARNLVAVAAPEHDPLYIDLASVQRQGSVVAFKYVLDVRAPVDEKQSAGQWRSNEVEASIDCGKKTVSVRRLVAYPGPKAAGNATTVHSFSAADVKPARIVARSTFAYLEDHLCRTG